MSNIISNFLVSRFVKSDVGAQECPFCGHVMYRHKISKGSTDILSLCEQCKVPCFEVISLQKRLGDQRTTMDYKKKEHVGAPEDIGKGTVATQNIEK